MPTNTNDKTDVAFRLLEAKACVVDKRTEINFGFLEHQKQVEVLRIMNAWCCDKIWEI